MNVRVSEFERRGLKGEWRGIRLEVGRGARAGFEVAACEPECVRVAVRGEGALWARVAADYGGYELLRARRVESLDILPPIPFSVVREIGEKRGTEGFERGWSEAFAGMLGESGASPLVEGEWHLGRIGRRARVRELSLEMARKVVRQRTRGFVRWDIGRDLYPITLREMSGVETGRVKAWRKVVREGIAPPVLLGWVTGLDAHVVLDGHDRLLAGVLEGVPVAALALVRIVDEEVDAELRDAIVNRFEHSLGRAGRDWTFLDHATMAFNQQRMSAADVNEVVLEAYSPRSLAHPTRAVHLRGGKAQWAAEVRAEAAAQNVDCGKLLAGLVQA